MDRVLVTGGAGFIGSHLVDKLIQDYDVVVLDDLSGGNIENIQAHMNKSNFTFIKGSIAETKDVKKALENVTTVFHFAAQTDVRRSVANPMHDFKINMIGGMTLLESMRRCDVSRIVFASSGGTVYGDSSVFPTPEKTMCAPISNYGAAKCAFEMYLSSYSELYEMCSVSLRLGNILGPRLTHGVIYDFYMKLKKNPSRLEVLGTGEQEKTYQYVTDTVDACLILSEKLERGYIPVNVSSGERITVKRLAELVCKRLGVPSAKIEYTGSKRGWIGDVVTTDLEISLIRSLGWKPNVNLKIGIRKYLDWLVATFGGIV